MSAHTDKSPADIAQDMRVLADAMLDVATSLDYYGGNNEQWQSMAKGFLSLSAWAQFCADRVQQ